MESKIIKLVPMEKVVDLMAISCKEHSLQRSEAQIIDAMINAFPSAVIQDSQYLSYDDVVLFMDNWIKAVKTKDFNFLTMKRGKRWELPPVDEIIDSPEYLNQKTQIRPAIRRELLRLYEPGKYFPEVILTGGTGIGKDYISYLIYGITLMELYSYWNPQVEFGLAAGTSIILAIQSITKELAKQVTFNELVGTILINSKFFRDKFSWDRQVTSELRFPNNIYVRPFSGEDTSALGMAIFSACFPYNQEYVCADGGYSTFGDLKEEEILTSDGVHIFKTKPVKAVLTGCKELVRLWFGEEYIDCTPNQKFKGEDNEWIDAERCSGIRLLSCDLPTLWEDGDLHGATFKISTQDGNEGVFSAVFTVICTKVERLIGTYPVFDIREVKETHTVIVPTKNKSIHLLAHNCANEVDFMGVVAKSKKAGGQEFNQAARIYKTLSRRIKGRFMQHGKVPGKMILISSTNKEGGFLHTRLQEVEAMKLEDREKVFIMKMSQWESFDGLDKYSPGIFLVEKGDGNKQSRIIESRYDAIDPEDVIEVPLDFLDEFEKDIDGAISDIAGEFVSGGRKKFIPYKEDIAKAMEIHKDLNDGQQLFKQESIIFDKIVDPYNPDYSRIVNLDYIKNILAPNVPYAGHIDYGFTGDGTGLAIGHVSSYKFLDKARVYNPQTNGYDLIENINLPIYHIDGVIQIKASSGSEVDIDFVEGLVYYLKEHINIQWMTFDSYESRASIQGFKKRGIISGVVSTVSNKEPYTELKNSIKTGRIHFPESKILAKEIRELERLPDGKIDHPEQSSKDCSDAVAGLIYVLMRGALKNGNRTTSSHRRIASNTDKPVVRTTRRSRFSSL